MKIILILLDGLGDRAYPALNHRTPLEAAETPNLDRLAAVGSNGLLHASYPGHCLPSEMAHYLLFGYDLKEFPGRGLLEAVGEGITHRKDEVLCLAHLAGVEWHDGVAVLNLGRDDVPGTREQLARIYRLIDRFETDGIHIRLEHTGRNDAILVLGGSVSERISDSDPIHRGYPVARVVPLAEARTGNTLRTATALNTYLTYCHGILSDPNKNPYFEEIPANFLLTQRCGKHRPQVPFHTLWGLQGAMIASSAVYAGLAREIGLTYIQAVDTEESDDDLRRRVARATEDNHHDFVHVHTKVPDEAAHQKDPEHKRDMIALLDRGLDDLVSAMQQRDDILLAVTADHSTPSGSQLVHSGEPVPLLICGPNVRRDNIQKFDEIEAARGCLGMLRGDELMTLLLNYANRSVFYGHRLGADQFPYFPPPYAPFRKDGK